MAPVKGMDFARNQLLKYGWKEGKGLGKNESGITDAIRPKLKFDTRGIGHDASEQFTYNWWEHAFNKAASNIRVDSSQEGVQVEMLDDSVDITTKKYSLKKLKKNNSLEYGTFLKTSKLTKGGKIKRIAPEIPDTNEPGDSVPAFESLTDEDLLRICGGRTAHKGARHGMKLNGKLARIQEQEQILLAKFHNMKHFTDSKTPRSDNFTNCNEEIERNVKKEKEIRKQDEESNTTISDCNMDNIRSRKIKHKKKDKIREKHLINSENDILENNISKRKKKSKRKSDDNCIELQKKSKRECRPECDSDFMDELQSNHDELLKLAETENNEDMNTQCKKKKKRKNKTSNLVEIT